MAAASITEGALFRDRIPNQGVSGPRVACPRLPAGPEAAACRVVFCGFAAKAYDDASDASPHAVDTTMSLALHLLDGVQETVHKTSTPSMRHLEEGSAPPTRRDERRNI